MNPSTVDVSIIIVNYNVKHFAEQCLRSVEAAAGSLSTEIFLVDNGSTDGSVEYLKPLFPQVIFIDNGENLGFGRANNIALSQARGKYILVLNPDTLVGEDTLQSLVQYMDDHPRAGAVGPKILTREGSFDTTSKRGFPTPWVAFSRFSGLARLFPKSKLFGRYDLLYLDPDKPALIDSLVGSCMMVRMETYREVGGFDEDYFMFGEDIDWCFRMKQADWEVHYAPVTKIVHFRGESTRRSNINRDQAFYGAMHLFVEKHFKSRYPLGGHQLIDLGIFLAGAAVRLKKIWQRWIWLTVDWCGFLAILALGRWLRWGDVGLTLPVAFSLIVQATVWTASLAGFGAYTFRRGQSVPLILGMLNGFLVNSSFKYFFQQFAYSRKVILFGLLAGAFYIFAWRITLSKLMRTGAWQRFYQRRTLIVGVGDHSRKIVSQIKESPDLPYRPVGFIDPDEKLVGSLIDGTPVLGGENDLARLVQQEEIEEVLFAHDQVDHLRVLELISQAGKKRGVNFKLIAPDSPVQPDGRLQLLSLDYLSPRGLGRSLKKISTLFNKR
ncbi:glycosyltransferase [bacterium]|nr:glycosyltransferase [bacterium]